MLIREGMNACSEDARRKMTKAVERGTGKKKSGTALRNKHALQDGAAVEVALWW